MMLADHRRIRRPISMWPARGPGVHDQASADHHAVSRGQRRGGRQGGHQPDRTSPCQQLGQLDRVESESSRGDVGRDGARHGSVRPGPRSRRCGTSCAARSTTCSRNCRPSVRGRSMVVDDFGDVFGVFLAITGDGYSLPELRRYAEFLRRELLLVRGRQERRALRRAGGSRVPRNLAATAGAARHQRGANLRQAAGAKHRRRRRTRARRRPARRARPHGRFSSAEDMLELVIGSDSAGRQLFLKDVATHRARRSKTRRASAPLRRQAGDRPRHFDGARRQRRDDGRRRAAASSTS